MTEPASPAAPPPAAISARGPILLGVGCGLISAVIWGVQAVVSRQSVLDGLTAGDVTILRYATAALVLLPLALGRLRPFPVGRLGWRRALILTAIIGPSYSMILVGGAHFAPALHSSVISPGLIPICTALLAWIWLGERAGRLRLAGLGLLVIGIALFSWEALQGAPTRADAWIGDLLFVLIALLWSVFGLLARRWRADAVEVTLATLILSLPLLPLVWWLLPGNLGQVAWSPILLQALYQGLLVGALALFLYTRAVEALGASRAALFLPLVPVVTALSGAVLLGEWPSVLETLGMAVAIAGMLLAFGAG